MSILVRHHISIDNIVGMSLLVHCHPHIFVLDLGHDGLVNRGALCFYSKQCFFEGRLHFSA